MDTILEIFDFVTKLNNYQITFFITAGVLLAWAFFGFLCARLLGGGYAGDRMHDDEETHK
jgi:hypothetical protein